MYVVCSIQDVAVQSAQYLSGRLTTNRRTSKYSNLLQLSLLPRVEGTSIKKNNDFFRKTLSVLGKQMFTFENNYIFFFYCGQFVG